MTKGSLLFSVDHKLLLLLFFRSVSGSLTFSHILANL